MTTPKETLWELDPHTKAKHEILRRYLAAWFPILGTYNSRIVYIDGVSGPGRYKNGDLLHNDVPIDYIQRVFEVMRRAHWHRFQVLTKRADRVAELDPKLAWAPNIWMGVSVESDKYRSRIDELRCTGALTKFLSLEPLLGPLDHLDLRGINWVIVGGESGPKARPMDPVWATDLRDQCKRAKVPFFFKQWGGKNKKQAGRMLAGRTWDQMPDDPVVPTDMKPLMEQRA